MKVVLKTNWRYAGRTLKAGTEIEVGKDVTEDHWKKHSTTLAGLYENDPVVIVKAESVEAPVKKKKTRKKKTENSAVI